MSSLGTDAQQFGKQIGKPITVSASVTKGLQEGGNVLVGSIQTEEAVKASAMIESVLKQVIAALSDPNVRNAMLPIQPELKGLIDQAAFTIYAQGAYSYRPILVSRSDSLRGSSGSRTRMQSQRQRPPAGRPFSGREQHCQ